MDIILVSHKRGKTWKLRFDAAHFFAWMPIALVFVAVVGVSFFAGYLVSGRSGGLLPTSLTTAWSNEIKAQRQELAQTRATAGENTRALARRLAQLNAHIIRLDAVGERMVKVADLDAGEFNFGRPPAVGGPETEEIDGATQDPILLALDRFETKLSDRERQMRVLEDLLLAGRLERSVIPSGWPVAGGFISSLFGYRTDPFTGRGAYHEGMDFAGREGSNVLSVASGIVTYAGERNGYGELVEINHGNGYVTRYGHNQQVLVKVGETVRKGQRLALMGSTGRSTGPHVHFEVLLNGAVVNPQQYIEAAR